MFCLLYQLICYRRKWIQTFCIFICCNHFMHITTIYYFILQNCMWAYNFFLTKKYNHIIAMFLFIGFLYLFYIRIGTQTYTKIYIIQISTFYITNVFPSGFPMYLLICFIKTYQYIYSIVYIRAYSKTILYTYFILGIHAGKYHHVIWIYTYIFLQIRTMYFINITYVYTRFYAPNIYMGKFFTTISNTFYKFTIYGELIPKFYYKCISRHFFVFFIYIYDTTIVHTVYQYVQIIPIKAIENQNIVILYFNRQYNLFSFVEIYKHIIQPYIYKLWIGSYLDTYVFTLFRFGTHVAKIIISTPYNKYLVYIGLVFLHSFYYGSVKLISVDIRACHTATGYHFTLLTKTYGSDFPPYSKLLYNVYIILMLFCKSLGFYQDFFCTNLYRV
ncbi:p360-4L [African swine fever virus]|uniref:p360-4L n=1 Tax=African swine fever virus TaxID=10497 RepID=A0A6G7KUD8_ASF|nr:p360-4L [African swine fever virus]